MKKVLAFFVLAVMLLTMATGIFAAATYSNAIDQFVLYKKSTRICEGTVAKSGSVSIDINASASDLSTTYETYHTRRTGLYSFDGKTIPAGTYTVSIWAFDQDYLADANSTNAVLVTFHRKGLTEEELDYQHPIESLTPVRLLLGAKDSDFTKTGKEETVNGNTWVEYSATFTSKEDLALCAFWIYCPVLYEAGAGKRVYIDDITVTENSAAAPAATTAAATTKAPVKAAQTFDVILFVALAVIAAGLVTAFVFKKAKQK